MEYTVNQLAELSGVSRRTLRYYDEIGLLRPERVNFNGYRIYGQVQVDLLQQILFYRELGLSLEEIGRLVKDPEFDREKALSGHLKALLEKKNQLELLIGNVRKTLESLRGEEMNDKEKFEGFKRDLLRENEEKYGEEIAEKYGKKAVEDSNARLMGMTEEDWKKQQELEQEFAAALKEAMESGDPAGEDARRACELHGQWLSMFWGKGRYSLDAHRAMGEMYAADERFRAYYDKIKEGAAGFLRDALNAYCS